MGRSTNIRWRRYCRRPRRKPTPSGCWCRYWRLVSHSPRISAGRGNNENDTSETFTTRVAIRYYDGRANNGFIFDRYIYIYRGLLYLTIEEWRVVVDVGYLDGERTDSFQRRVPLVGSFDGDGHEFPIVAFPIEYLLNTSV